MFYCTGWAQNSGDFSRQEILSLKSSNQSGTFKIFPLSVDTDSLEGELDGLWVCSSTDLISARSVCIKHRDTGTYVYICVESQYSEYSPCSPMV